MKLKFLIALALIFNAKCNISKLQNPVTISQELENSLNIESEYLLRIISQLTIQEKCAAQKKWLKIRLGCYKNSDEITNIGKIILSISSELDDVLKKIENNKYHYQCSDCQGLFVGIKEISDHRCHKQNVSNNALGLRESLFKKNCMASRNSPLQSAFYTSL